MAQLFQLGGGPAMFGWSHTSAAAQEILPHHQMMSFASKEFQSSARILNQFHQPAMPWALRRRAARLRDVMHRRPIVAGSGTGEIRAI
jgi:hypothetical protein